jgi:hypothetical protein
MTTDLKELTQTSSKMLMCNAFISTLSIYYKCHAPYHWYISEIVVSVSPVYR